MQNLLTYADLSVRTGISPGALRKQLHDGRLPAPDYRLGGSPVWVEKTLAAWFAANKACA